MVTTQQQFPATTLRIVDDNGFVTQPWLQFFISLQNRTGGEIGVDVTENFLTLVPPPVLPSNQSDAEKLTALSLPPARQNPLPFEYFPFIPVVTGTTTAGSNTYSTQSGHVLRLGQLVTFNLAIVMTAKDGAMAGNTRITGLPIICRSANAGAFVTPVVAANVDLAATTQSIYGQIVAGTSYIDVREQGDNVATDPIGVAQVNSNSSFFISGLYWTN